MPPHAPDRRSLPADLVIGRWPAGDGWPLRCFGWRPAAGVAPRGTLLFQAGRGDFLEKYVETFAHFRSRGWHVTGFDWRGQGGSCERPEGGASEQPLARMADDLAEFVRGRCDEAALPLVAIGHSMGGFLLLRMLAERRATLDAAVLVAPMLGLNSRPLPPAVAAGIARWMRRAGCGGRPIWRPGGRGEPFVLGRQAALTGDLDRYADETGWLAQKPGFWLGPPTWAWLADAFAQQAALDAPGVLERVAVPVLLIGATRDRLVDPGAIVAAARRLPAATLVMRDDGAHELLREVDAIRSPLLADIDAFLDAVAPA